MLGRFGPRRVEFNVCRPDPRIKSGRVCLPGRRVHRWRCLSTRYQRLSSAASGFPLLKFELQLRRPVVVVLARRAAPPHPREWPLRLEYAGLVQTGIEFSGQSSPTQFAISAGHGLN